MKICLVLLMATMAAANEYTYHNTQCQPHDLFAETSETFNKLGLCGQKTGYFIKETSTVVTPAAEWAQWDRAEVEGYYDTNCNNRNTRSWAKYRLDYWSWPWFGAETKAYCSIINGKEYYYVEDAVGGRYGAKETGVCLAASSGYEKYKCVFNRTLSTSTTLSTTTTAAAVAGQQTSGSSRPCAEVAGVAVIVYAITHVYVSMLWDMLI